MKVWEAYQKANGFVGFDLSSQVKSLTYATILNACNWYSIETVYSKLKLIKDAANDFLQSELPDDWDFINLRRDYLAILRNYTGIKLDEC